MIVRVKNIWDWIFKSPEIFFLVGASMFGMLFILLTPPLQTPDETPHFLRAYQVSRLGVISTWRDGVLGAELPVSLSKTIDLLDTNPHIAFHSEYKYNLHKTAAALHIPLNKSDTKFLGIAHTSGYAAIGYIPQAIGVGVGELFNLPPVLLMYMARLGSLIAWILLLFFSIRLIPYRKWTMVGLALLPMLVAQSGSPGIDTTSIGLSVLFISSILYLRTRGIIEGKWWLLLVLLGCLIALTKQTSILAIGFVFLLQWNQFDDKKWKGITKKLGVVVLPLIFITGWSAITSYLHLAAGSGVPGQDTGAQLAEIIQHPLRLPAVIFNTFFLTWGDGVITSFMGNFGSLDTPLSGGMIVAGYITLAFILFASYEKVATPLSRAQRWLVAGIVGLYVVGTLAALYLTYSPVGFEIVYGLQGRYLLLVPFMLIPLTWASSLKAPKSHYINVVRIVMPLLLLCSAVTIYMRFYYEGLL